MTAPIFESYEAASERECEAGDFNIVISGIVGVSVVMSPKFELVGCNVVCGSHPGAADGEIHRIYRRLADKPATAPALPQGSAG